MSELVSIDDTDPRVTYGPSWDVATDTDPSTSTSYFNRTYHDSKGRSNLTIDFVFSGVSLTLYGTHTQVSSTDSSPHRLIIDDTTYELFPHAQQGILFASPDLGPARHHVRLITGRDSLHFDRFSFTSIDPSSTNNFPTPLSTPSNDTGASKHHSAAVIVAPVLAIVLAMTIVILCVIRPIRRSMLGVLPCARFKSTARRRRGQSVSGLPTTSDHNPFGSGARRTSPAPVTHVTPMSQIRPPPQALIAPFRGADSKDRYSRVDEKWMA
ncbi:hypothetical protein BOTBODRAFT_38864 [Botryobasidium botryosum FD-172 SS1]|uniref:Uncharacterized protein n=1 Tax=Botryobasidium botryosum (strain FD-172 SS1) TaxID=930990 RepID=A0A067LVJ5_BOTB1|nr:hypothetical protein BOTBODRAFT_38864 [Botryobasidium botryosum FD-172 SS1]